MMKWLLALVAIASVVAAITLAFWPESEVPADPAATAPDALLDLDSVLAGHSAAWPLEGGALVDSDLDGLPDVVENFVYGSDPQRFSTTQNGIPDGWFVRYGYDPTIPGVEGTLAAIPAPGSLPDVYHASWPERYMLSLGDMYQAGMPLDWPANETWDNGFDPRQPLSAHNGIPVGWLLHYGVSVDSPAQARLGNDALTVRENFEHDTNPFLSDTDDDGLTDAAEIAVHDTNPREPSTAGTGIPDGWLVHYGLDPLDPRLGPQDPAGKGLTILETWNYNHERFGWHEAIGGTGLHPGRMSHSDNGIPDGWLVEHGFDPLEEGIAAAVLQCASDFVDDDGVPPVTAALPDLCLDVGDHYRFARPDDWNEARSGPWRNGLDPGDPDQDEDGLASVVELRGWTVERYLVAGPSSQPDVVTVTSDPRLPDTDGDGLTDGDEMRGLAIRDGVTYRFSATDPSNPDTAFSGLTDMEKVLGRVGGKDLDLHTTGPNGHKIPLLDPTRIDSAGDYLPDGIALQAWNKASEQAAQGVPYNHIYPGSLYTTFSQWLEGMPGANGPVDQSAAAALLAPDGDVDGDGIPNVVDPSASGDGLLNGWELSPGLLQHSPHPTGRPRTPTDPANPDTDGDGLPDEWEITHGQWSSSAQSWDLDPTQHDSDHDGISDPQENLDGDVTVWYSYPDETRHEFPFTNQLQYEFGTDPRQKDENGDGVPEGFAIFWGHLYPSKLQAAASGDETALDEVGSRVPSPDQVALLKAALADPLSLASVPAKQTVPYLRFADVTGLPDPTVVLRADRAEAFEEWAPATVEVIRGEERIPLALAGITGEYTHGLAEDAFRGLNPYLLDTDGDTLPDAWEALYPCLEPTRPGTLGDDSDQDGITDHDEFLDGTDPCLADTDLGGVSDGQELGSPLDPFDDAIGGGAGADTDRDGILDTDEITAGTRPDLADSDRDGLLDGDTISLTPGFSPSVDDRITYLKSLGIAQKVIRNGDGQVTRIEFLGERDVSGGPPGQEPRLGDPRDANTWIPGIPDGWLAYHAKTQAQSGDFSTLRAMYECGRPSWWNEAQFGVWWWGLTQPGPCPQDRDMDGLDDRNGEDATPAARQTGEPALSTADLLQPTGPRTPQGTLQAAQTWGECAGDPTPCMAAWNEVWNAQFQPVVASVHLEDIVWPGTHITKEETFSVTGRASVADCDQPDCPIPGRTVVLRIVQDATAGLDYSVGDGRIISAGFTEADGSFELDGCVCAGTENVGIPTDIVALGRLGGSAEYARDVSIAPGAGMHLLLHVYASSADLYGDPALDPAHPQFIDFTVGGQTKHATRAGSATSPDLELAADSSLALDAPASVAWGDGTDRRLELKATLLDASGTALSGQELEFHVGGLASLEATTGETGDATVQFTLPAASVGATEASVSYAGRPSPERAGEFLVLPSSGGPTGIALQAPLSLSLIDAPDQVTAGAEIELDAVINSPAALETIPVRATLGDLTVTNTTTDGATTLAIPTTGVPLGTLTLRVQVQATDAYTGATVEVPLAVTASSVIQSALPSTVHAGDNIALAGRVALHDGSSPGPVRLRVLLDEAVIATLETTPAGQFQAKIPIDRNITAGPHTLTLTFDGAPGQVSGATRSGELHVTVPTQLHIPDVHLARGSGSHVHGTLQDPSGNGFQGQIVAVEVDGLGGKPLVTDNIGNFSFRVDVPADHPIGPVALNATYNGSMDGTLAPSNGSATLFVGAPMQIEVTAPPKFHRGANHITGRVTAVEGGDTIPGISIHFETDHGPNGTVVADADGRFDIVVDVGPGIEPGRLKVQIWAATDAMHGPAEAEVQGTLQVPTRLATQVPADAGRGTNITARVALFDDRDLPVAGHQVSVHWHDRTLTAFTSDDGRTEIQLPVPHDMPLGESRAEIVFGGDADHERASQSHVVHVKSGVRLVLGTDAENVTAGAPLRVSLQVVDLGGQPVAGHTVSFWIPGQEGVVLATTDSDGQASAVFAAPTAGPFAVHARSAGTADLASNAGSTPMLHALPPLDAASMGPGLPWRVVGLAASTILGLAAAIAWRLTRRMEMEAEPGVEDELHSALRRIEAGDPWTAAVLTAYGRLSRSMEARGLREARHETVRDFVQSLAHKTQIPEDAAVDLVRLFEMARYNEGDLAPNHARAARDALRRILQAVDGGFAS